jgi:hypothetical protein
MKPTKSEAAALGKLFPTTTAAGLDPGACFDSGSFVFSQQKRKKKKSRIKPSKLILTLLATGSSTIPRGKQRKSLEESGQMVKIEFSREMSNRIEEHNTDRIEEHNTGSFC